MKVAAIIAAGGVGKRIGANKPKQYLELLGKPILCHTLDKFLKISNISELIVILPEEFTIYFERDILKSYGYPTHWKSVSGGEKRQDSVRNGLRLVPNDCDVVLVHDGCRPFISPNLIDESIKVANKIGAAIVAAPIKETIKKVSLENQIIETVDRQNLWGAQTPQAFRVELLKEALEKAYQDSYYGTDDASLVERLGKRVEIIKGDSTNIKITTPSDLIIAKSLCELELVTTYTD